MSSILEKLGVLGPSLDSILADFDKTTAKLSEFIGSASVKCGVLSDTIGELVVQRSTLEDQIERAERVRGKIKTLVE